MYVYATNKSLNPEIMFVNIHAHVIRLDYGVYGMIEPHQSGKT